MDLKKLAVFRNKNNPYAALLGIQVEEIGPGSARAVLPLTEKHLNPVGVPHGGVYFSLADTACGSAMASHGYYAVTVSTSFEFLRSGRPGDTLTAVATEVKGGRTICVYDVRIANRDGVLLGSGTFTFYKLDREIEL